MMETEERLAGLKDIMSRKELQAQYREREMIGGVFAIRNLANDKLLVGTTADLAFCSHPLL